MLSIGPTGTEANNAISKIKEKAPGRDGIATKPIRKEETIVKAMHTLATRM